MKKQPLLTIAIPTYNGSRTICNMLDLLLPQCNSNVEILISDNCSTDKTQEIIKEYIDKWEMLTYWCNKTNIKTDRNCIRCLKTARGRFTWLMSDDDIVMEGAVQKVLTFLEKHPNAGLVYLTVGRRIEGDANGKLFFRCLSH